MRKKVVSQGNVGLHTQTKTIYVRIINRKKIITYQQIFGSNGIVRVEDQKVDGEAVGLPKFRADQQASGTQQLKVIFFDRIYRKEPVHIVNGQRKNVFLAFLLLANLWQNIHNVKISFVKRTSIKQRAIQFYVVSHDKYELFKIKLLLLFINKFLTNFNAFVSFV